MLRTLGHALSSSVGKKAMMGLSGLLLVVFLIEHVYGNLKLVVGSEAFDDYREQLHAWGFWLRIAEVGLFGLFAFHILLGIRLGLQNREARSRRYAEWRSQGRSTPASLTMLVTGSLLVLFLVKHWTDFRFDETYLEDPYATVAATLSNPAHGLIYVGAMAVLGLHLFHGLRSAFQSLGASHPRLDPLLVAGGRALAVLFAVGFAIIPIWFMLFWKGVVSS